MNANIPSPADYRQIELQAKQLRAAYLRDFFKSIAAMVSLRSKPGHAHA